MYFLGSDVKNLETDRGDPESNLKKGMSSTVCHWLSVESRVNDLVRKRQYRISNVTENVKKHSMIWGMFMSVTVESAVFMGKNFLNTCQSIVNTTDITLKHMFDISTRLVSEQDEISALETIGWDNHS